MFSSTWTSCAITGTRLPPAEARIVIARRYRTALLLPVIDDGAALPDAPSTDGGHGEPGVAQDCCGQLQSCEDKAGTPQRCTWVRTGSLEVMRPKGAPAGAPFGCITSNDPGVVLRAFTALLRNSR
ncbi:hypothetical protein [Streptomyces sp. NPDC057579]|uniref:hypothetical protein n=1 Tax=Streptomyces sp. NPDC057579 TaxID=3346172 RepID=UPI0036D14912